MNINTINTTQAVFGDGILSKAVTGVVRIPAMLATLNAVSMLAELTLRGLTGVLGFFGIQPAQDGLISQFAEVVNGNLRPYRNVQEYPATTLAVQMVAMAVLGILSTELCRVASGPAPRIYNDMLTFVGPVRIDPTPYWDNVTRAFAGH